MASVIKSALGSALQLQPKLSPTTIYGFDGNGLDSYMVVDASVSDNHTAQVRFTEHPIEFGAKISDHGIIEPRTYTLTGRVSSVDIRFFTGDGDILEGASNRPQLAWEKLQDLMFARDIVTVETNLKVYDSLVLESLSVDQGALTSRVLDFVAVFRELFVVDAPRTEIVPSDVSPIVEEDQFVETNSEAFEQAAKTRFSVTQVEEVSQTAKEKFAEAIGVDPDTLAGD